MQKLMDAMQRCASAFSPAVYRVFTETATPGVFSISYRDAVVNGAKKDTQDELDSKRFSSLGPYGSKDSDGQSLDVFRFASMF